MNIAKLKREVICQSLSQFNLNYSLEEATIELAKKLALVYSGADADGETMVFCDECGCISPEVYNRCPFCGDESAITNAILEAEKEPKNELEGIVLYIKKTIGVANQNLYNIGKALVKIVDDRLWTQRIKEDGSPAYTGPYECIEAECGVSPRSAKRIMSVVRAYDEKTFNEHGITRLQISLQMPPQKRKRFLDTAKVENDKRGPDDRALARSMISENEQEDPTQLDRQSRPKVPAKIHETARVRLRMGTLTVPMNRLGNVNEANPGRATSLKDFPWCDVHLGGDIFLGIRISRMIDGEIVAMIETKTVAAGSGNGCLSFEA